MPVYAYTCRDCGTPLEVHQEFSDAALTVCPVCGGRLRKQYGSIGVTFNGSGFYRTDSRAGAKGEGAGSGDGGSTSGGTATGTSGASTSGSGDTAKPSAPKDAPKPASAPAQGA